MTEISPENLVSSVNSAPIVDRDLEVSIRVEDVLQMCKPVHNPEHTFAGTNNGLKIKMPKKFLLDNESSKK